MTTYEIQYNKKLYLLTLDNTGTPVELLVHEPVGPDTPADLNELPQWLVDKVQNWWENTP